MMSNGKFIGKGVGRVCAVDSRTKKGVTVKAFLDKLGYSEQDQKQLLDDYSMDKCPMAKSFVEHDAYLDEHGGGGRMSSSPSDSAIETPSQALGSH